MTVIQKYISIHSPAFGPLLQSLYNLIDSQIKLKCSTSVSSLKVGHDVILFSTDKAKMSNAIIYLAAHKNHVNLGFTMGAHLKDKHKLLEGTGKNMRHVKITPDQTVSENKLTDLIGEAIKFSKDYARP